MSDKSEGSIKKYVVIGFLSSFFGTIFIWTFFLSFVFGPDYFIQKSFPHKYAINSSGTIENNSRCLTEIGHLVSKGVIVDVKEIWAFQGDYYSALITVLIAILGLLGAVAFFYVKTISLDKVQEYADTSAKEATKQAIKSFDFYQDFGTKIQDELVYYDEKLAEKVNHDEIKGHLTEIQKRFEAIERVLSTLDSADSEGSDLELIPGDDEPEEN